MAHGITSFWLMAAPFELSSAGDTTRTSAQHQEPGTEADEREPDFEDLEAQASGD